MNNFVTGTHMQSDALNRVCLSHVELNRTNLAGEDAPMRIAPVRVGKNVSVQSSHLDRPHAVHLDCNCAPT